MAASAWEGLHYPCGTTQRSPFRHLRASPEFIRLTVVYVHFPLPLKSVEGRLNERGRGVSQETARVCRQRFGPMFSAEIRQRRVGQMCSSRWLWHLD
jgi:putative transposase